MHAKEVRSYQEKVPVVGTDRTAESLVDRADLAGYDLSRMRLARFELAPKSARKLSRRMESRG
jgi:hypothetical protein